MWYSSWNFTPDPRGKILTNKPCPRHFSIPGERLDYKGIKNFPDFTLKARATYVKLILGVGGMGKICEADSLAKRESASPVAWSYDTTRVL
jgi:hypothetical protein